MVNRSLDLFFNHPFMMERKMGRLGRLRFQIEIINPEDCPDDDNDEMDDEEQSVAVSLCLGDVVMNNNSNNSNSNNNRGGGGNASFLLGGGSNHSFGASNNLNFMLGGGGGGSNHSNNNGFWNNCMNNNNFWASSSSNQSDSSSSVASLQASANTSSNNNSSRVMHGGSLSSFLRSNGRSGSFLFDEEEEQEDEKDVDFFDDDDGSCENKTNSHEDDDVDEDKEWDNLLLTEAYHYQPKEIERPNTLKEHFNEDDEDEENSVANSELFLQEMEASCASMSIAMLPYLQSSSGHSYSSPVRTKKPALRELPNLQSSSGHSYSSPVKTKKPALHELLRQSSSRRMLMESARQSSSRQILFSGSASNLLGGSSRRLLMKNMNSAKGFNTSLASLAEGASVRLGHGSGHNNQRLSGSSHHKKASPKQFHSNLSLQGSSHHGQAATSNASLMEHMQQPQEQKQDAASIIEEAPFSPHSSQSGTVFVKPRTPTCSTETLDMCGSSHSHNGRNTINHQRGGGPSVSASSRPAVTSGFCTMPVRNKPATTSSTAKQKQQIKRQSILGAIGSSTECTLVP